MGHVIRHAVQRAGIGRDEVEDVVVGTALPAGTSRMNLGRLSALAAGLPHTASGQTIDRQCASGLMAIGIAAKQIIVDAMNVCVGGGQENISAVQTQYWKWMADDVDQGWISTVPQTYVSILETVRNRL